MRILLIATLLQNFSTIPLHMHDVTRVMQRRSKSTANSLKPTLPFEKGNAHSRAIIAHGGGGQEDGLFDVDNMCVYFAAAAADEGKKNCKSFNVQRKQEKKPDVF